MKTLKLYIDGVKCEFASGKMYYYPETMKENPDSWLSRNIRQVIHYVKLTASYISLN